MPGNLEAEVVELYRGFYDQVFGYCVYRLFRKDLAEDAVAQVFLLFVEKYPSLRHRDRAGIRNWLYGAASNEVARCRKDAKRRRQIAEALAQAGPGCDPGPRHDNLDWPVLHRAMGRLDRRDQEIVTLRYYGDLDSNEIADALGMKPINVRVRLSRAIKRLKKELGESLGEA